MNNTELTPCGDDRLDCIDCCGFGACEFTLGMENRDESIKIDVQEELIKAVKDVFGWDINAIKRNMVK